jgi:hypothetical protein
MPFVVNKTIERNNITATSDNTGTLLSQNILHQMSLLSKAAVIFLSSIVVRVLTPNGEVLDCATVAFSDQYHLALGIRSKYDFSDYNLYSNYQF